ncbi:Transcriptional repressor NrdR like [Melia azedarach]|uniref:Transcriptional repressor NrdR like n=1 Tax=Melia azedarach TaxID=155640 RepID=A0ACC1X7E7_MELAZ|nr:Transcriptional repressor NrdR like [Melia azedarach]
MELMIPKPNYNSLKRYWRRTRYQKLDGTRAGSRWKKKVKITRLRGSSGRFWRIKAVPKLLLRINIVSPLQLWTKFKNAYVQMMNNWAGKVGYLNDANVFGGKMIPKAGQGPAVNVVYSGDEVEKRLVLEIYKALVATQELSGMHAAGMGKEIKP